MTQLTRTHHKKYSQSRGFTFIEMLLAIAIFSIMGLATYTLFDSMTKSNEKSALINNRQNELQRAFVIIERDFIQIAQRTARIDGEAPKPKFLTLNEQNRESEFPSMHFVKGGWTNPALLLPRSDMQSVSYQVRDHVLERLHYNYVDPVVGEEPKVRPLISKVESIRFEFYNGKKWSDKIASEILPKAVAIELELEDYGVIRRQFLLAGGQ